MKAVIFQNQKIFVKETPMPVLADSEALVKVDLAGICTTDFELLKGYYDFNGVPGHEFVGSVWSAPGRENLTGKRVVADINCGCGVCDVCFSEDQRYCGNRSVIGIRGRSGVFAEYAAIPVSGSVSQSVKSCLLSAIYAEPAVKSAVTVPMSLSYTLATRL